MDYEISSDAALLEQEQQPSLNRDTSVLLLDVNPTHSNIINNPTLSPQHANTNSSATVTTAIAAVSSLRNSISPISTSPTANNKSHVVVNLDYPNSMQTITTLQRNNVKNSSTNSNRSQSNSIAGLGTVLSTTSIGNNIKVGDNGGGKILKANKNRKYKFNLLKLSSSPSSHAGRSTRNRLLIVGIAIGAFIVHMSEIYHCNANRIGM